MHTYPFLYLLFTGSALLFHPCMTCEETFYTSKTSSISTSGYMSPVVTHDLFTYIDEHNVFL